MNPLFLHKTYQCIAYIGIRYTPATPSMNILLITLVLPLDQ
jgi:hypothetical protein